MRVADLIERLSGGVRSRQRDAAPPAAHLPEGVACAVLTEGRVYLAVDEVLAAEPLRLAAGEHVTGFERPDPAELRDIRARVPLRFGAPARGPLARAAGRARAPEVRLNALPDWALPDRRTYQIALPRGSERQPIELLGKIDVPPQTRKAQFTAWLAVHRGTGVLIVTHRIGSRTRTHEIAFDPAFHGGTSPAGYQLVEIDLPVADSAAEITLALDLAETPDAATGGAAYFFVADPRVQVRGGADAVVLENGGAPGEPQWFVAEPGTALSRGMELNVLVGTQVKKMLAAKDVAFELVADHGHTIVLKAGEIGDYMIAIDGKPALTRTIGTGPTPVPIPARFMTGGHRRLSVWDKAGLQEFFSTYVLMPNALTPAEALRTQGKPPYPASVGDPATHRYRALKSAMARARAAAERAQILHCLDVLEAGPGRIAPAPLNFPDVRKPDVSVVIPAHNNFDMTYLALASLLFATNRASFEVILVDDASDDATSTIEELVSGITVLRNTEPQRFIRACNAGAAAARGRFVALLNNDVEVTEGWLDALLDAFGRFENVGLAGSKLLYPDGRLQDGGGLVWKTGNPWNYGHGQNPSDPRFCYARQVDYLSGAAMLTTKEIWDAVGGLSDYLEPMYFEDTDFAFKVRAAGYATWFVPSSLVYHFEGSTAGTDTASGFKKYQEVNRPKFKRTWANAFAQLGEEGKSPDLEKDRNIAGRVLFIDHGMPRPDRDAGSFAAIQEIRLVQSMGYKVTFLPQNLAHLGGYTDELERMGVETLYAPYHLSVADFLERRAAEFDAAFITRYHVAQTVIGDIRRLAPQAKILFNNADLHFLRELRAALAEGNAAKLKAAGDTRTQELEVMRRADVVLSYSEVEHSVITSHTDGAVTVVTCPWVVDLPASVPPLAARSGLSFLGNFAHHPNAEGVDWFVREVAPLIAELGEAAELSIYGSGMTDDVRALARPGVVPVGYVTDAAEAYDRHRVFVAPLRSGAGIKGKVLAALAHGIPCVLSPIAAEGVGLRNRHDCMIARTPGDWQAAIAALLGDDALWRKLSENGREFVREDYSFERGRALMRDAFEAVGLFGR